MDNQTATASTLDRIRTTITQTFGQDPVTLNSDVRLIDDLLFDSLDMVELAMALEEEFGIDIPDADWENAADMSLTQAAEMIDRRLSLARTKAADQVGDGYYDFTEQGQA